VLLTKNFLSLESEKRPYPDMQINLGEELAGEELALVVQPMNL
jgi:hypothetical protein